MMMKLLYPRGPGKKNIFIKSFEVGGHVYTIERWLTSQKSVKITMTINP